jgi:hypothetical protein
MEIFTQLAYWFIGFATGYLAHTLVVAAIHPWYLNYFTRGKKVEEEKVMLIRVYSRYNTSTITFP